MKARRAIGLLLLTAACGGEPPAAAPAERLLDAAYRDEIESWRADRYERLREPDGWLSLAGLYWLEEGASTIGSDPQSDLLLPTEAARHLGVLRRSGRRVVFQAAPGARVSHAGEPVSEFELASDAGDEPTVLAHGGLRLHVIERGERVGVRLRDLDSELVASFEGIDHYPVDPAWRLEARFEPYGEPRMIDVPNITGDVNEVPAHGRVTFTLGGAGHSLEPLGEPSGELFLVFGDATNGGETYGGGRFLYAGPVAADGRLIVDFNKAHNPPCVFTPYATCPLPPPGNRLPLPVTAGEKSFAGGH